MKFCVAILFVLSTITASAQRSFDAEKISPAAKAIIAEIENDHNVPSDTMGLRVGYLPKDYPLTLLREKLTIDELFELTNHNNAIVRCYCFKALTQRDENIAFNVIINHLQDTIQISTYHGCLGSQELVGDYFIGVFQGDEATAHNTTHLTILDSLVIFTPNKLDARNDAIRRAGKKGKYYARIREIAINDHLAGAIIALAGFRRPEDVDIIMQTKVVGKPFENHPLGTTFFAIGQFPHPAFFSFLTGNLYRMIREQPHVESSFLYEAIANYNTKEASAILASAFQISDIELRQEHLKELSRILNRNPNPVYDDLRKKIAGEVKN